MTKQANINQNKRLNPYQKPTLKTVAEYTGYSVALISRALKDDPAISPKTRQNVTKAAKLLNYVPDRAAQRLRTGRTKVIKILIDPSHEFLDFTAELLSGFTSVLNGTGYSVGLEPDNVHSNRVEEVQNIIRHSLADGVILSRTEPFDERVRVLLETGFPFVTHGRTEFSTPHPWVDYDNTAYARLAVKRLISKGRKRIAILLPDPRYTFSHHLRYGFETAAKTAGVEYFNLEKVTLDSPPHEITEQIKFDLTSKKPPDGLVCVGEVTALCALAALDDCGMKLGREMDIVAKRTSPIFDLLRPKVDVAFEGIRQSGIDMAQFLLRRIEGEDAQHLQRLQAPTVSF